MPRGLLPVPPTDAPEQLKLSVARHNVTELRHAQFVSSRGSRSRLGRREQQQQQQLQPLTPANSTVTTIDESGFAPQFDDIIKPKMKWSPQLKALLEGVYEGQGKSGSESEGKCDDNDDDIVMAATNDNYDDDNEHKSKKQKLTPSSISKTTSESESSSPLSKLYYHRDTILKHICENFIVPTWKQSVLLTNYRSNDVAFTPCQRVEFPEAKDLNVNMIPFVLGKKETLPESLWPYYDMIIMMCPLQESELGKVLYLTVHEGWVEAGQTQRRGGLHIESPRYGMEVINEGNGDGSDQARSSTSPSSSSSCSTTTSSITSKIRAGEWKGIPGRVGWGRGVLKDDEFIGGLYMASTIANTCVVYHALVDKVSTDDEGGCEHLRHLFPPEGADFHERQNRADGRINRNRNYRRKFSRSMEANELVWMTDRTPHEVIPQTEREYRQFFRLVTSSLSIWNKARSTTNENIELPSHVLVVDVPPR